MIMTSAASCNDRKVAASRTLPELCRYCHKIATAIWCAPPWRARDLWRRRHTATGKRFKGGGALSEHQAAFMDALRAGREMRKRMFDTIEQRHADDFANGQRGKLLYEDLLAAVRDSGAAGAAEEFETRFFPLLDPDRKRREAAAAGGGETGTARWSGARVWLSVFGLAVVAVGVAFLAFNLRTPERSLASTPIPAADATQPASETITELAPAPAAEAPVPAADAPEATPEPMAVPAPAPAAEQESPPER
jgi:hypothetical protein